jgi:hypothetical protein
VRDMYLSMVTVTRHLTQELRLTDGQKTHYMKNHTQNSSV